MVIILSIVGLFLAYAAWVNWHPIAGLVVGFLMVGGLGWMLLGSLFARIAFLFMPERNRLSKEFVAAWEERFGEIQFPGGPETPRDAFQQWARARKASGMSAGEFLDRTKRPDVRGHVPLTQDGRGATVELRVAHDGKTHWSWAFDQGVEPSLNNQIAIQIQITKHEVQTGIPLTFPHMEEFAKSEVTEVPAAAAPERPLVCAVCGARLSADDQFCPACGSNLG